MPSLSFAHDEAASALVSQIESFVAAAESFDDLELLDPALCRGWSRVDVVVHVRAGLEEMARGTSAATSSTADTDAASYWRSYPGANDNDSVDSILWLRRVASAYTRPGRAITHLKDVARGTIRAIRAMPPCVVEFQHRVMTSGDFLGTWVVEVAVHQLDLNAAHPWPPGLGWTRQTIEALAGARIPADLDDLDGVLAGLGRHGAERSLGAPFPVSL
jgi:hypothetical protein